MKKANSSECSRLPNRHRSNPSILVQLVELGSTEPCEPLGSSNWAPNPDGKTV